MLKSRGLNLEQRIRDISIRSGFSQEVVRSILSAESDSILHSLRKGEKAYLEGRCIMTPVEYKKYNEAGEIIGIERRVRIVPASKIKNNISKPTENKEEHLDISIEDSDILTYQIDRLA